MEYNELEKQWTPLINKFSISYNFPGYDTEDVAQELRIVLHRVNQLYDPDKGTKFITYLYNAFNARVRKLNRDTQGRKKNIPKNIISYLHDRNNIQLSEEPDYDDIDLFAGLSLEASQISALVLDGKEKRKDWLASGMSKENIKTGLNELKQALKGGQK